MSYGEFARVYDLLMKDVPYDSWLDYLKALFDKHALRPGLMLELGCGTGNMTIRLAKAGYEMIGVDLSAEMLLQAKEKAESEGLDILFLQQDMREFELYGSVSCILSLCDSMNYILEERDLLEVFMWVDNYLEPCGLFIFDMNTHYKCQNAMECQSFIEDLPEVTYIWDNFYDEETRINEYALTLFIKRENDLYDRVDELHYEKAYTPEKIREMLEQAGLKLLKIYDDNRFTKASARSERVYYVAKKEEK